MTTVHDVVDFLQQIAPPELAEDWDNTGLLLGDVADRVTSILTCLTLTPDVAAEAIQHGVTIVVSHHPILFRPVQSITSETSEGRMLTSLMRAGVSVYSPHTSYDSAREGINAQLSRMLELKNVQPIRLQADDPAAEPLGSGRYGDLQDAVKLESLMRTIWKKLAADGIQFVGDPDQRVQRVAIACGSAAEFTGDAVRHGCQVLLTGEASFHACLEARNRGINLVLPGHYPTERPAMESLAHVLSDQFPTLTVSASHVERDPVRWLGSRGK